MTGQTDDQSEWEQREYGPLALAMGASTCAFHFAIGLL